MSGPRVYNPYGPVLGPLIGGLNGLSGQNQAAFNSNASLAAQHQLQAQQLVNRAAAARQQLGRALLEAWTEPEEPPKHEEFVIGELIGHRCWRVQKDGFLTSITADEIWAPDEPMTTKEGVAGLEGRGKGDIGIHAFKFQRHALKFANDWSGDAPMVYGQVHLWGDIVEHEIGYRAEYARITSIDGSLGDAPLDELREQYCPQEAA